MASAELPLSFVVQGVPVSAQTRNRRWRRLWIDKVKSAAAAAIGNVEPLAVEVTVVLVYFYRDGSPDVDNIIKPILDGMNQVVYEDDRLIDQVTARKTDFAAGLEVRGATAEMLEAFDEATDFVYVSVQTPPDHRVLP